MHRVWGGHRGWQIAWDSACLLSHFTEVHGRLVDCGLVGVKLDAGTRQQLQALHQAASPSSAAPAEANGAAAREPSQTKEPSVQSPERQCHGQLRILQAQNLLNFLAGSFPSCFYLGLFLACF